LIFVTVGMHNQGFDRLISAMDEVAANTDEQVVMQIGSASLEPTHAEWFHFADGERVSELIDSARIVVAHAGAGTIITTFKRGRPLIVVPRLSAHGEHIDDHQLDLAEALAAQGKVCLVTEPTLLTLQEAISQAEHLGVHQNSSHRLAAAVSKILKKKSSVEEEDSSLLGDSRKTNVSS
jgi:beta-1,4-N-acetylglucosaminyltransferase